MEAEIRTEFDKVERRYERVMARIERVAELDHQRHLEAMARMDDLERKHTVRMDRADEKFERKNQAIQKLIAAGMKMLVQNQAETRELKREMRAFLQSRNGHNGNGRRRIH